MLHFLDFETFKHDWMCVIISPTHKTKHVIVNDRDKLVEYYEKYKDEIFVGYNVRAYDSYIMKAILLDFNPKEVNDFIIMEGRKGWEFSDAFRSIPLNFYDVMTTQDSLKKLEGFMGNNIDESEVDFNIDRKLTAAEIAETIEYCAHDVEQTMEVFMHRKADFHAHMAIINAFNLPLSYVGKTKTQLSAEALEAVKQGHNDEFDIEFPPTLKLEKYKHIKEWYEDTIKNVPHGTFVIKNGKVTDKKLMYEQELKVDVAGVPHVFAWGGIHGAIQNYIEEGQFLNMDVASYYPSMMIEYGWLSRNVPEPKKYEKIYRDRLRYKAEKNPLQAPYKLVLNSTYGATKDKYNKLYDPRQANCICIGGQLLLLDLIEMLEPYCDIIQSNTDGILVKLRNNREEVERIAGEWSKRTRMVLEFEEYTKVIQRDVNNYIIVGKDGYYKSKGGVVKAQNKLDFDTPILNEAIVNYFVFGTPLEDTINKCDELIKFQKIYRVSSKYDHAMHGDRKLDGKTFRVFASKDESDGGIFKVKSDKPDWIEETEGFYFCGWIDHEATRSSPDFVGMSEDGTKYLMRRSGKANPEKFANSPDHCFIINGNVNGMKTSDKLDRQFYIDMAQRRVAQFIGKG